MLKRKAEEVVKFLRSQQQQIGDVKLLGVKVLLPDEADADEVSAYISQNYIQYDAHVKSDYESILSIGYKHLSCIDSKDSKNCCAEDLAEEVVKLFQNQKRSYGDLKLLSIKVMLPKEADPDEISTYIVEKYYGYKAHSKDQGAYPIVAIGYNNKQ